MQYDSNFICDEEWSDFSFALSSDKVNIEINESQFSRSAEVKIISNYEINKVWSLFCVFALFMHHSKEICLYN